MPADFSIAKGIGKTRLLGAFVTYLVKEKAWKYALIPQDKTDTNMTFMKLVAEYEK